MPTLEPTQYPNFIILLAILIMSVACMCFILPRLGLNLLNYLHNEMFYTAIIDIFSPYQKHKSYYEILYSL